jgi:chromosome partitioning protein
MPGVVFDRNSRGAQAYLQFGAEMIDRVRVRGVVSRT